MPGAGGPPVAAAALVRRLGYTVADEGREFVARRTWRTVADGGQSQDLRCQVTGGEAAGAVGGRVAALDPDSEWAVVGLGGGHEAVRAP